MPNTDQITVNKIHARAREFRGVFLNHLAVIERDMSLLITEYFCSADQEKQQFFFDNVACKLTLEKKRSLLLGLIKKDYPHLLKDQGQSLQQLQQLQEFRNKLAHSVVDISPTALARPIELGIGFVQWMTGTPITEAEMDDWCARANMVSIALSSIRRLLPFREN